MKKYFILFAVIVGVMASSNAWAITGFSSYFTNGDGIYDLYSGDVADTPYLYLKVDGLQTGEALTLRSFWEDNNPSGSLVYYSALGSFTTSDEIWIALTSPYSTFEWSDAGVGKVGDWTVRSNFFTSMGDTATFTQNLTVTPEPLSTALFIFGGMPLAAGLMRKRRR
jgi:hypothetical protein